MLSALQAYSSVTLGDNEFVKEGGKVMQRCVALIVLIINLVVLSAAVGAQVSGSITCSPVLAFDPALGKNQVVCTVPALEKTIDALTQRQPSEKRERLLAIYNELVTKPVADLNLLKYTTACEHPKIIVCRSLDAEDVKPYVEAALEAKKSALTEHEALISRNTALASLAVSCLSLVISFFTYRQKAKEAASKPVAEVKPLSHDEEAQ